MNPPKVHLICNAHLDPVWQWRWEEGCAEALSTFRSAVELLHEFDQWIFNHNEALLYRWVQKYDPGLFREIQKLVHAGRWHISGGWYLQPDVNLPGTESIIRHIIEGRRFFREHFGVMPEVAYNFDSFGHSGALPQILLKAGYEMYIHWRPLESEFDYPGDLYRWRGVDGSEILSYRIALGPYHSEFENMKQRLQQGVALALQMNRDVPVFWGIGDHGGGATRDDLQIIQSFIEKENRVEIIHSTPERFYRAVKDLQEQAPVVEGGLQRSFTGCYTSLSRLKRAAQRNLQTLVQTEALCTASWWALGQPFPEEELNHAWRDHLFNDFHDVLPGSCIEPAERDALEIYGKSGQILRRLRLAAATAFNRGEYRQAEIPLTVLNANATLTRVPVEAEFMLSHRPKWSGKWHVQLQDLSGNPIVCQEEQPEALLPFNGWRRKICFMADLPGIGAKNFRLKAVEGATRQSPCRTALNFEPDETTGLVRQLFDHRGEPLLSGLLAKPIVVEDLGDSWGTNCWAYRKVVGEFQPDSRSIRLIEKGPVRNIWQSIHHFHHSKIIIDTIGYADWQVLEIRLRIHWNEERKRLKLSIPTRFKQGDVRCEIPGGVIDRPADGQEHVHGRWLMLADSETALAVVHTGLHGFDCHDGEIRLSVLRSAAYCHEQGFKIAKYPARKFMDQGVHQIRLLVVTGKANELPMRLPGLADWLDSPPAVYAHLPIGSMTKTDDIPYPEILSGESKEFLPRLPQNLRLSACKPSADRKKIILRLQEIAGKSAAVELRLNYPESRYSCKFKPYEIKTVAVDRAGGWKEVDLIDE